MPFSVFEFSGERFQMRDSRLETIIDICFELSSKFIEQHKKPEQLDWLAKAVCDWKEELILPPGCKWIQLDEWLTSVDRRKIMVGFFGYVASHIKHSLPASEAVLAKECGRVQKLILQTKEPREGAENKSL